ncbi:MAG: outer-membrane lipoprotein carrier protein [Paracoccaceae bacterium]|nr:MAG: outer membrane lipoprotein carrier protein LolA [Alphaproteobacteria bacterium]GIX12379.1 MAG: outer-membrane lipoprotein carrier protein [Paracoccaceae bacterium]
MHRRLFIAAALALLAPGALAQGGADVQRISTYLNALTTLTGSFVQTNPDGSISEGRFYIRKPGLMRFEYEPPNPALVISDGVWVAVIDRRSNTPAQRYPLSDTPLDLLLRDRVDLAREGAIRKVEKGNGQLRVTAVDPDAPQRGSLTLIFSDRPLELRQWIVVDDRGQVTTVLLSDMKRDVTLDRSLFSIESAELDRR